MVIVFSEERRKNISKALTGKKLSEEHKQKLSLAKLGINNHNFGKPMSEEQKKKISEAKKGKDRSNGNFTYRALHKRIRKLKPIPKLCDMCGLVPPHDAANISGKYLKDLSDWQRLCVKCHSRYDWENFGARKVFYT